MVYNFYVVGGFMKKIILTLGIILIYISTASVAYAGTLNSYEQDVIAAAGRNFEYKGAEYRLDPAYIAKLENYLASDEVDLTKEQRDSILGSVNDYIQSGIDGGYLVPAGQKHQSGDSAGKASGQDTGQSSNQDENNSGSSASNNTAGKSSDTAAVDSKQTNTAAASAGNAAGTAETMDTADSSGDKFMGGLLEEADTPQSGETAAYQSNNTAGQVIKDTGFNLDTTIIIAALMGVLMIAGILIAIKNNYFAQSDE